MGVPSRRGWAPWVAGGGGTLAALLAVCLVSWFAYHDRAAAFRESVGFGIMVACVVLVGPPPKQRAPMNAAATAFAGGVVGGVCAAVISAVIPGVSGPAAPDSLAARLGGEAVWWLLLAVPLYTIGAGVAGRRPIAGRMWVWSWIATIVLTVLAWFIWGSVLWFAVRLAFPWLPPFQ